MHISDYISAGPTLLQVEFPECYGLAGHILTQSVEEHLIEFPCCSLVLLSAMQWGRQLNVAKIKDNVYLIL